VSKQAVASVRHINTGHRTGAVAFCSVEKPQEHPAFSEWTGHSLLVPFRESSLEFAHASVVVCLLEILCEATSIQHHRSNIIVRASVCYSFQ